ncbi:amino acid ABC transporter substrate-binding protein [Shewanella sp. S-1]|uniref:Amino acid ABC transporter substrate-binding protein n=2 Tax=Shewanella TaxID=22 RepID=A0ABX1KHH8_9GAMM|nr:transporter substrate-binding domain-containing protein [Shewanella oncorhynchi]NLQ21620.1 amino acid ABC transporter substrate-binding protein [Shewanella oncorhynchi]
MGKKLLTLSSFCLFLFSFYPPAFAGRELHLVATNYPPFYADALPEQGGVAQVVKEAFKRKGYTASLKFYPFARAALLVKTGQADGIIGLWYRKEREQWAQYSAPIQPVQIVFYKRKDSPLSFSQLSDLKPFTIGIGRGYANPPEIFAAGLTTEEGNSDEMNLKKLFLKRIDLVLIGHNLARYLIKKGPSEYEGAFEQVGHPIATEVFHLGISLAVADHPQLVTDFNQGLESMRRDGRLAAILSQYPQIETTQAPIEKTRTEVHP